MVKTKRIKLVPQKYKYKNNISNEPVLNQNSRQSSKFNMSQFREKKPNIFKRFNNFLNNLSTFQYILLVIVIATITIFSFDQISRYINNNSSGDTYAEGLGNSNSCKNPLDPNCWGNGLFPELKQKDDLTNALLIGLDTRDNDSGLLNTDTILLASYDHKTGKTMLISFPRDLYVPYKVNGNGPYNTKINSIYAIGVNSGQDGMELLKSNIEDWFDIEIQYTAKVYFETVIQIVDSMGGIDIELSQDYTDIYPFIELSPEYQASCKAPDNYPDYCLFTFYEGINHLSGEEALIYSRMRQYSSDFDRARRQQQVLDAIKEKGISDEGSIVDKAQFGWGIYQTLQDENSINSNIEYKDLLAGLFLLDKADLDPIKIVLDPSFAGGGLLTETSIPLTEDVGGEGSTETNIEETSTTEEVVIEPTTETTTEPIIDTTGTGEAVEETVETIPEPVIPTMYVILLPDNSFDKVKAVIDKIRLSPDLYREKAVVTVVNASGEAISTFAEIIDMKDSMIFWGKFSQIEGEKRIEDYKYTIYVFDDEKEKTVDQIKKYLGDDSTIVYVDGQSDELQTSNKEHIKIVVAEEFINN